MQIQTRVHRPLSIRFAHLLNRALSWGLHQQLRDSLLAEALADWNDTFRREGPMMVTIRALRGIPAGIWARLDDRDVTAPPAAISISLVGVSGIGAGSLERAYPVDIRRFMVLTAIGTLLFGIVVVGIGFAVIVLASYADSHDVLVLLGGAAIAAGTALFGVAQVGWGIVAAPIDPLSTATSLGVGLAALALLHVMPRLRESEIVRTERVASET